MRFLICALALAACSQPRETTWRDKETHLRNIRQLTFGGENAEAYWSFDETQLIFQSTRPPYKADQIFTMKPDGSDVKLVSTGKGRTTCSYFLPGDTRTGMTVAQAAAVGVRKTIATWKSVLGMPDLRRFLLAYFFYMDGVNTVIWFAGVYASATLGFEKAELIIMFGLVQIAALAGSIAMGGPTDRKGPRWTVRRRCARGVASS